jgi:hypothetical protein
MIHPLDVISESLHVAGNSANGKFLSLTGQSGNHWASVIPSLKVSGYGNSAEEAQKDLKYNLDIFFEDFFALNKDEREVALRELGWQREKIFKKRYTGPFINQEGALQNFNIPEDVQKSVLEPSF